MFEFESEVPESRIDAEVGLQQGTERSLSRSAASIGSLAAIFSTFSTVLITPLSWFSDSVDRFQDVVLSGVASFTTLTNGIFDSLSAIDDALAASRIADIYQTMKYITGIDLLIPFWTDWVSPILIILLYILTGFLIMSVSMCIFMILANVVRRLISILPFFKAI